MNCDTHRHKASRFFPSGCACAGDHVLASDYYFCHDIRGLLRVSSVGFSVVCVRYGKWVWRCCERGCKLISLDVAGCSGTVHVKLAERMSFDRHTPPLPLPARGPLHQCDRSAKEAVGGMMGSTFALVVVLAHHCNIDLPRAIDLKMELNAKKYPISLVRYYDIMMTSC